jgi:hypothetical protein
LLLGRVHHWCATVVVLVIVGGVGGLSSVIGASSVVAVSKVLQAGYAAGAAAVARGQASIAGGAEVPGCNWPTADHGEAALAHILGHVPLCAGGSRPSLVAHALAVLVRKEAHSLAVSAALVHDGAGNLDGTVGSVPSLVTLALASVDHVAKSNAVTRAHRGGVAGSLHVALAIEQACGGFDLACPSLGTLANAVLGPCHQLAVTAADGDIAALDGAGWATPVRHASALAAIDAIRTGHGHTLTIAIGGVAGSLHAAVPTSPLGEASAHAGTELTIADDRAGHTVSIAVRGAVALRRKVWQQPPLLSIGCQNHCRQEKHHSERHLCEPG